MADVVGGGTSNVTLYDEAGGQLDVASKANQDLLLRASPVTGFDERLTTNRTPLFNLSSTYPLTPVRDVVIGNPVYTGQEYLLNPGDRVESAEIGRYIPGYEAEAGMGVRVVNMPVAGQILRWGYYDDFDGFFYELTTDGLFVVVRRDGADARVNILAANGERVMPPVQKGVIYQFRYTWYGYGQILFRWLDTDVTAQQHLRTVQRVAPNGATSVRNPNLPLTAEVIGAGAGQLALAGRQYSILGLYVPQTRTHGVTRTLAGVTSEWTPLIAFRRRSTEDARRVRLRVEGIESFASADCEIAIVVNSTLTFGTPVSGDLSSVNNSAVEFSVNPTGFALGNGDAALVTMVRGGSGLTVLAGSGAASSLEVAVPRQQPVVMVARALGGLTASTNISALLRTLEEW